MTASTKAGTKKTKEKVISIMNDLERHKFYEAMTKEWKQQFDLGALELLTEEESAKVPENRIIPSRWVLVDKYEGLDPEKVKAEQGKKGVAEQDMVYSKPKARWVAGGHRDPDLLSLPRTDAPTADLLGQHLVLVIAASKGWKLMSSDVSSAFLRGRNIDRNLYVKLPKPLPPGLKVTSKQLAKLKKAMYGLSEAPRLWFLEYRRVGIQRMLLNASSFSTMQQERGTNSSFSSSRGRRT